MIEIDQLGYEMKEFPQNFTRRQTLGFVGTLMASTAISWPDRVVAQTSTAISPPKLRSALGNSDQLDNYLNELKKFALSFKERFPKQEMGPIPSELDEFYVLDCVTRNDIPLNYPADNPITYNAPSYVDGYLNASMIDIPPRPTVGPTLEIRRGSVTGVMLSNAIDVCGDAKENLQYSDNDDASGHTPHGFQVTNLHTHGLHVSPNAPSDDVLVTVDSSVPLHGDDAGHHKALHDSIYAGDGTFFPYIYEMRPDHPVGTFWYHPHKHGSVASQVAPGMAGALIVREKGDGDADFDTLLAQHGITQADEEIIVIQTLKGNAVTTAEGSGPEGVFFPVAYYDKFEAVDPADCFGLGVNKNSLDIPPSVNGVVNPTITMEPGQIKRLRIVNASSGATFVPEFVHGEDLEIYAIAVDGIALHPSAIKQSDLNSPYFEIVSRIDPVTDPVRYWTTAEIWTLAPGQRLDLLVKVKEHAKATTVQVKDAGVTANQTQQQRAHSFPPNVIETSTSQTGDLWQIQIVESGGARTPQSLPTKLDFIEGAISRPPSPIYFTGTKPRQTQELNFRSEAVDPAVDKSPTFTINGKNFDPNLSDTAQLTLGLDQVTEWTLFSSDSAHIFHIHINSFQAVGRITPGETIREYAMPIWRDTIYFDGASEADATRVKMLSLQVDYTGEYVLHCHNLFHEDSGMMMSVEVKELS